MAQNINCWLGSLVIFQGIKTSIAKKPYSFVILQGGPDPLYPSGSVHAVVSESNKYRQFNYRAAVVGDLSSNPSLERISPDHHLEFSIFEIQEVQS